MPNRVARLPVLTRFQREVTKALTALHTEITQREQALATLKEEAAQWQRVLQEPSKRDGSAATPPRVRPAKRPRLDWNAIYKALPPRFTTKEVARKAGKPLVQVYTHLSGWRKDKQVRRVKDGYQKISKAP